jgi:hypothetical protein
MHAGLIYSNNSTWEFFSRFVGRGGHGGGRTSPRDLPRHRITYLAELPLEASPFDLGLVRNVKLLLFSASPVDWESVYKDYMDRRAERAAERRKLNQAESTLEALVVVDEGR